MLQVLGKCTDVKQEYLRTESLYKALETSDPKMKLLASRQVFFFF